MPILRIHCNYHIPQSAVLGIRWICLTAATACFAWGGFTWLEQRWYQAEARRSFEQLEPLSAKPLSDLRQVKKLQTSAAVPMAKLDIARLHVTGYVEDGFDERTLRRAIGHAPRSAKPGQPGNVVLAAHRDTFFAGLRDVRVGDTMDLRIAGGELYHYRVSRVLVVDRKDSWVMQATPQHNLLTLITCYPFRFAGSAPNRLVVQAEPIFQSDSTNRRPPQLIAEKLPL